MAFSVHCNFNRIQSYADALKAWQGGIIFPKDRKLNNPYLPRGLVNARKRHMTVERARESENITLCLYDHDIVTWHPDNSFTIVAYLTRSTTLFADHCTPSGVWVCSSRGEFAVHHDGRFYKVGSSTTFRWHADDGWKPDVIIPWTVPFVNRERATQALRETGYKEFRLWLVTYVQMAPPPRDCKYVDEYKMIRLLNDRTQWRELVAQYGLDAWKYPNRVLDKLRHAIYREYDCIGHKQVPFLGGRGVQS